MKKTNKRRKIDDSDAQETTISNPDVSNWAKRLLETRIPLLKSVTGRNLYGPDSINSGVREVVRLLEEYPCLHHHTYDHIEMVEGYLVNRPDRLYITAVSGLSLLHTVANCLDVPYEPSGCISTGARMNRTANNIIKSLLKHYQTKNHSPPPPPPPPPPPQNSPSPQDDEIKEACAILFLSIHKITIENVERAYERLAFIYHPDKSKRDNEDKLKVIDIAKSLLMNHLDEKK